MAQVTAGPATALCLVVLAVAFIQHASCQVINGTLCLDTPAPFQPSGLLYHSGRRQLLALAGDGQVLYVDPITNDYSFGPNLDDGIEAITVADPSTTFLYAGITRPATIVEYNLLTATDIRRFVLDDFGSDSMEALTFVPSNVSADGGYFYCGNVATGAIRVYDLPLVTRRDSDERLVATYGTFLPGETDISDIVYYAPTRSVFLMYGNAKKIVEVPVNAQGLPGNITAVYSLALDDVEGIYVVDNALGQKEFYLASSSLRRLVSAQIVGTLVVPRQCSAAMGANAPFWLVVSLSFLLGSYLA
eukprot:Opistho-2@94920